jgi:PST family polysaccharide transporter
MSEPERPARSGVARGAAWTLVYLAALRLASFGQSVAVARVLGPAGAGAFGVALNVSALAGFIAAMNLPPVLARTLAREPNPGARFRLVRATFTVLLATGVLATLALWFLSGPLARLAYRDPSLVLVLRASGPLALATALLVGSEHVFHGLRRFDRLALWGVLFGALDLGLGLAVVHHGVPALQAARTAARLLAIPIAIWLWRGGLVPGEPESREAFRADVVHMRGLLLLAVPAFLTSALFTLVQTVLRLLLVRQSGLAEAGVFQVADTIGQGVTLIPAAAAIAFLPSASRDLAEGRQTLGASLQRALERVSGLNLAVALVVAAVAVPALSLLFGRSFEAASFTLVLLAWAYALGGLCSLLSVLAMARGDLWPTVGLQVLWGLVTVGVFVLLASRGSAAAGLALVAGFLVQLGGLLVVVGARWRLSVLPLVPAVLANVLAPGLVCVLALLPGVPAAARVGTALLLALVVFLRWGVPALREQPWPFARRRGGA